MKTRTKVISNKGEHVLDVVEIQTVYEEPFPRQSFELEDINNENRMNIIISSRIKRKLKLFFLVIVILGLFSILFFYLKIIDTNNNELYIISTMNSTSPIPIPSSPIPIPIPSSPTLSICSSFTLSPTSIIPIPSSPVLSLSLSSSLSSSLATSSILTPSETMTPSSSPMSSISSILTPSETSSILTPSETSSISPSREYDYIVADRHECIGYTAHWCHHSCNHYPPYCPGCCIKI